MYYIYFGYWVVYFKVVSSKNKWKNNIAVLTIEKWSDPSKEIFQ